MESLFGRVFLSFWAAIVLFATAAMAVTTLNFIGETRDPREITRQAGTVLYRDGRAGLETWLRERNARHPRQRTFVVDEHGRDILGQPVPRRALMQPPGPAPRPPARLPPPGAGPPAGPAPVIDLQPPPRHGATPPPHDSRPPMPPGSRIFGADGAVYRVLFDPPPRRGPFSPPFSGWVRAGLFALAMAISGFVSYLLARSISRPLGQLQSTARTLADGRLEVRTSQVVSNRRDEIGALAREFDAMAERLEGLLAARQQLLRDLSHELRSPLARLQMAVGLARQDSADVGRQFERIERESDRLATLVSQILELARLDRDPSTLVREEVPLDELVQQVVRDAEFESQSAPGRITLQLDGPGDLAVMADRRLMHAAIDNVVRNALLHGGSGSIEVECGASADRVHITVRDHGPGVPPEDLERIFEPFYRVDEAATTGAGTGIGLAVAAKSVTLHGGRIHAENAAAGGLKLTISLPRKAT